jgi:NAD-dependent deacetylase
MNCHQQVALEIARSRHMVALTGAGISVESGIPDFRSAGGLWSRYDPMEYGHIDSFRAAPDRVWKMLLDMNKVLSAARPNPAHRALAEMERRGLLEAVITQNVDGLHQEAGSRNVIEFHGTNRVLKCDRCHEMVDWSDALLETLPPRCRCGGPLRPDFVFFGEGIPAEAHKRATEEAQACDLMMVVGTSASVAPASYLPYLAKSHGALILEVNPASTELTGTLADLRIAQPAGSALSSLLDALDTQRIQSKESE